MSQDSFGEYLKRERQMRGVSLEEICAATRISVRFLEALESEQWDILPGGVFNRGFVRAVARFLGLDEEDLVAQYAAATKEKAPSTPVVLTQPVRETPRTNWAPWIAAAAAALLVSSGWYGWHWRAKTLESERGAAVAAAKAVLPPPSAPPLEPAPPDANAPATGNSAAQTPSALAGDELQLKLEAGKDTLVTVRADGQKIFEGSLSAGESRTFTSQNVFEVSAQDAGALLLELNGQTLAPIGPPGQPGKVTVTRQDLKRASGGAN